MGYNQENFRRIREEYSRKYLLVQEAATKRRDPRHPPRGTRDRRAALGHGASHHAGSLEE